MTDLESVANSASAETDAESGRCGVVRIEAITSLER